MIEPVGFPDRKCEIRSIESALYPFVKDNLSELLANVRNPEIIIAKSTEIIQGRFYKLTHIWRPVKVFLCRRNVEILHFTFSVGTMEDGCQIPVT